MTINKNKNKIEYVTLCFIIKKKTLDNDRFKQGNGKYINPKGRSKCM